MPPRELKIRGIRFFYLRTREHERVSVYKGGGTFLRIGPKRVVQREVNAHHLFARNGFEVSTLLSEGTRDHAAYYIETSAGIIPLSTVFRKDYEARGEISQKNFERLLRFVKRYVVAQHNTARVTGSWEKFFDIIHLNTLRREIPIYSSILDKAFQKIRTRLARFPFVLSHGDFNAHNIFPYGLIDMEHVLWAPAGYDLITLVTHINMFPVRGLYEFKRSYDFTKDQKQKFFSLIDVLYQQYGLPRLSDYQSDFSICRAVWSSARMQKYPRLQKWRFARLVRLLKTYL